jgi:hypothetical protein
MPTEAPCADDPRRFPREPKCPYPSWADPWTQKQTPMVQSPEQQRPKALQGAPGTPQQMWSWHIPAFPQS